MLYRYAIGVVFVISLLVMMFLNLYIIRKKKKENG
jgi:hypothetical protein